MLAASGDRGYGGAKKGLAQIEGAGLTRHGSLIRFALGAVTAALLLVAAPQATAATLPAGFQESTLASGLANPSSVVWAPDGRMFTNQGGQIRTYAPGSTTGTTVGNVGGFIFGLGVDANYATNRYIYALYASGDNARLARLTITAGNTIGTTTVILGKFALGVCPAPSNTVDCIPYFDGNHTVGTVISDARDGTLWVGIGDSASPGFVDTRAFQAQNEQAYAGKILHINRDGKGLSGHPYCPTNTNLDHVCTKVHSIGMRNPYRFTLRPGSGGLAVGDAGWEQREEFDIIKGGGKNYGWPCYEGKIRTPGYSADSRCPPMYAKEGTSGAAVPPVYDYVRPSGGAAVVGGPTYVSGAYPDDFDGDIFFADYVGGYIKRLELNASDQLVAVHNFATAAGAVVDLQIAPNGNLTYTDFAAGTVKQIRFTGAGSNRTPVAKAAGTPSSGPAPLTVGFSSAGTSDPDGNTGLVYDWDFGDGTAHSSSPNPSHTYTNGTRNFTATLKVTDPGGLSDTDTVTISPGNRAPNASITAPATYRDGQAVQLSGAASDPDQGNLPASALAWEITLIHIDHEHPLSSPSGVSQTSFTPLIDHDADSHYRVTLTATDSRGIQDTETVTINPETRQFTLASSPSGAPVTYGGSSRTTPFSKQSAIGFRTSISAAQTFSTGGKNYEFVSWSDGGARLHDITIPASDTTITATYREVGGTTAEDKALSRTATSSSVKPGGWGPELAVDGNQSTRWSSAWGVNNQWWQVDLGSARQVDKVTINWFTSYATRYLISTSTNGTSFTQAADVTNNAAGNKTTTFTARSARYVRITGLTRAVAQYGISFWTASVFGPSDGTPPPPPPPPDAKALLVVKTATALNGGDTQMRNRLQSLGYTVTVKSESATSADAAGMDVVVISGTVTAGSVGTKFRTVAVPVVVCEALIFDDMGLAGANLGNFNGGLTAVTIASSGHPLAAGLTGTPTVTTTASTFGWGVPTAAAAKVATLAGDPTRTAVFGYTTGAAMSGLNAPARRVGFFFSNDTPTVATTNGWKLFDAAVGWAKTGS